MLDSIDNFYQLIFKEFKFSIDGDNLKVRSPIQIEDDFKTFARDFISDNKEFIISTLKNNTTQDILCFNLANTQVPLSFAQERLWFIDKYEEGTNAYNIPMAFKLSNLVKLNILETSIKAIINRHEVLRTVIKEDPKGKSYQTILDNSEYPFEIDKMRLTDKCTLHSEFNKNSNHIFKLSQEYPIKVFLYSVSGDEIKKDLEHYLYIVIHHIAFDGWSADVFFKELNELYYYYLDESENKKVKLNLPRMTIQYKDFSIWQRSYLSKERLQNEVNFWKDKLIGYETLNLTIDKLRPKQIDYFGSDVFFEIDPSTSLSLRELARKQKVSLFSVLLAGYYLTLRSYSGQNDIIVGISMANRHYSQVEEMIGFFVNTLALRLTINSKEPILNFLERVGREIIEAQLHQDLPFEKLVDELKVEKDTSRHPIFQICFGMENFGKRIFDCQSDQANTENLLESFSLGNDSNSVAKFDISVSVDDSNSKLKINCNYAASLFNEETINNYMITYLEILKQLSRIDSNNSLQVYHLNYLTLDQYRHSINEKNATDSEYPKECTIQGLFEAQVEKTPNAVALIYEEIRLSYRDLNNRANRLAHYLRENYSIKADDLICLCLERSEHMLIAILAVLKAGGAYVPIDPNYPEERINYLLKDTATKVVITNEFYQDKFREIPGVVLIDNTFFQEKLLQKSAENPKALSSSSHLAYVIYTSGTTGNPKGVMIEHQGVVNLKYCLTKQYALGQPDNQEVIVAFANYVFDASVEQIILSLLNGYSLLLMPDKLWLDKDNFYDYINKNNATHLDITPSLLEQYNFNRILCIRRLIVGGEALSKRQRENFSLQNNVKMINMYGPTEVSIDSLCYDCTNTDRVCIGKPISNTKVYVLNADLIPIPVGAVGELYIGGIGLARGYLNRPELTAERFIANPFQTEAERRLDKNARLYKTGDLVRWLADGNLEYIGRNDFQVKIRGYRIELGEIENVLCSYAGIKQAVVLAKGSAEEKSDANAKFLVGYYVSDIKLDEEVILNHLRVRLPDYMVPSVLLYLEKLPLTLNGKLDRKALPEPNFIESDNYLAPRNELEKQLCQIWCEVLGLPENAIGIRADFFKLGGDSIVSIQLVSRLRQRLALNVNVKEIFTYKTIERLYDNILSKRLEHGVPVEIKTEQGLLIGEVSLLPIQRWFFESHFKKASHWNQAFIIKVPCLEIERLRASVAKLVFYHDAFRLRYRKDKEGNDRQYYDLEAKCEELKILDIREIEAREGSQIFLEKLSEILTEWQSGFDLGGGPLYSIGYIQGYEDGSARIHFAIHHLLIDTVSWRILVEDLRNIYNQKELGNKGSSYRQWVEAVKNYGTNHESERVYWDIVLEGYRSESVNKLIFDSDKSNYTKFILSEERTRQLLQESHRAYHTQVNDILLTALGYALSELTNDKINYIVLEGHGREEIEAGIEVTRTMGWFTTVYPVQLEMKEDLGKSLKNIKETIRQIPCKGLGYGALLGYVDQQLPRVSFNYLGQFDQNEGNSENSWQIVRGDSGKSSDDSNDNHNILDINGSIIGGRLQFSILSKLDADTTHKIADIFKKKLEMVIEYTASLERSYLTASDIHSIISQDYLDRIQANREVEGIYLANSLQQGFIYHSLYQGDVDDAYIVQSIWHYNSRIAVDKLVEAWRYAQRKYQALRLRFFWEEELVQVIDKMGDVEWQFIDLSSQDDIAEQETEIHTLQEADQKRRYYLDQGNLFRLYFIKQKEDLYTCIFSSHHAILDGWSGPILLDYVHDTYLKLVDNQTIKGTIDPSYEYAQKYIQEHQDDYPLYWEKYLSNLEVKNNLNGLLVNAYKDSNISEYKYIKQAENKILTIQDDLYSSLKQLSEREGFTLNAILQYVWHKILHIYTQSDQTVVGTTISGRNLPINDMELLVGLYINTLPLIVDHRERKKNVIRGIKDIQNAIHELNNRSCIRLSKLQKTGVRLFDSLFVYENYPTISNKIEAKLNISYKGGREKVDYPLGISAYEKNQKLIISLEYAGELFRRESIENLLYTFKHLLDQISQISDCPNQTERNLTYLDRKQTQQIVTDWNQTEEACPNNFLHHLFEEQVTKTPDKVAVVSNELELSYQQLNERANNLAHYLKQLQPITPDTLIVVCLSRSEQIFIALLAVLKAGGAYVPVDPNYPDERIRFIMNDSRTRVVLTEEKYQNKLLGLVNQDIEGCIEKNTMQNQQSTKIISLDNKSIRKTLLSQLATNPFARVTSIDLAYVIYTSGTTGNPKGVMIEHRSICNRFMFLKNAYKLDPTDSFLYYTSFSFDASIEEILLPLITGAKSVIFPAETKMELNDLLDFCYDHQVTTFCAVPSLIASLLPETDNGIKHTLRRILVGGEALPKAVLRKMLDQHRVVWNLYGPTEASINATAIKYDCLSTVDIITIGKPLSNTQVYVLNADLISLPIGAVGELYLGGIGLARGYLNRPELTAERFIANPFQTEAERRLGKNARLYKTGDLVRWLADGNLEYIGRNDFQVKIRGYRIELGEIENVLCSYAGIKQAVVLAKGSAEEKSDANAKFLVGYYVSDIKLDEEVILNHLRVRLPDYMVPSVLLYLEKLPLTLNGKLDRKALPEPNFIESDNYLAPRNELEKQLCQIWCEVLGLPENAIGIRADFFKLGGDSIVSIQLVSRLRQRLALNVNVKEIFTYKTIERLYDHVLSKRQECNVPIETRAEQGLLSSDVDLLPIQRWFFESHFKKASHWNQSFLIKVPCLEMERLRASVAKLVFYHDAFRLRYREDKEGNDRQYYDLEAKCEELKILDIREIEAREGSQIFLEKLSEILTEWQSGFDLGGGPLYSIGYIQGYEDGSARIHFAIHHLLIDTVSWRILVEDLRNIYNQKELGNKGESYRQWVEAVKNYGTNDRKRTSLLGYCFRRIPK